MRCERCHESCKREELLRETFALEWQHCCCCAAAVCVCLCVNWEKGKADELLSFSAFVRLYEKWNMLTAAQEQQQNHFSFSNFVQPEGWKCI